MSKWYVFQKPRHDSRKVSFLRVSEQNVGKVHVKKKSTEFLKA